MAGITKGKGTIDMKRIIENTAYNTATAMVVAKLTSSMTGTLYQTSLCAPDASSMTGVLYQTNAGEFFVHEHEVVRYRDWQGECKALETDNITPINQEQAKGWAVNSGEIINDVFNDKAKANTATIYVRVPSTLKSIVEDAAKAKGMSVNSYAIRCLEQAL